jgi:hypothetical protein
MFCKKFGTFLQSSLDLIWEKRETVALEQDFPSFWIGHSQVKRADLAHSDWGAARPLPAQRANEQHGQAECLPPGVLANLASLQITSTGYEDTGHNPSSAGGNYGQNNEMLGFQ